METMRLDQDHDRYDCGVNSKGRDTGMATYPMAGYIHYAMSNEFEFYQDVARWEQWIHHQE